MYFVSSLAQEMSHLDEFMLTARAARCLGIHRLTLHRWGLEGKIAVYRNPKNGYRFFKATDIKELARELPSGLSNFQIPRASYTKFLFLTDPDGQLIKGICLTSFLVDKKIKKPKEPLAPKPILPPDSDDKNKPFHLIHADGTFVSSSDDFHAVERYARKLNQDNLGGAPSDRYLAIRKPNLKLKIPLDNRLSVCHT